MRHEATVYELAQWARDVKDADGWACVLCGQKPDGSYWNRAEAHHIKPKSLFPGLALDLTNGITLCHRCHSLAPHRPGALEYPPLMEYLDQTIIITIPKGLKQAVEAHAKSKGESINGLVNALLRADMGLSEAEWKAIIPDAPSKEE